jgi:hypothetical protein
LFDENLTSEEFVENLGKEFEGIERFGYEGDDIFSGSSRDVAIDAVSPKIPDTEIAAIQEQLEEQIPNNLFEQFLSFAAYAVPVFGSTIARQIREAGPAEREALVQQHVDAIKSGATPQYDEEGRYTGFDISTMGTFADEVLSADDISVFLPPTEGMSDEEVARRADADQDGVLDVERFEQVFDAQSKAADADPLGKSTEQGFIMTGPDGESGTDDDIEYFVTSSGEVVEVKPGEDGDADIIDFDRGGGQRVDDMLDEMFGTGDDGGDDDSTADPCPEGMYLDPVTNTCMPIESVADTPSLTLGPADRPSTGGGGVTTPVEPDPVAPIKIRSPKQFAAGGAVTPNIDRFLGSMRG